MVTIGPATTALYYTVVKVIRRDRGYLTREFFHAFKVNFKNGLIAGVIITFATVILIFDRNVAKNMEGTLGLILFSIFNGMLFLLLCITIYIFPVLSRFKTSVVQLFKSSFFMALKHLPTTIVLLLIIGIISLGIYVIPILLVILPAVCYLLCSFLLERVFKKYMPEKSDDAEAAGVDEWYLE